MSLYTKRQRYGAQRDQQRLHYVQCAGQAQGYRYGVRIQRAVRGLMGARLLTKLQLLRDAIARYV